jgi:transposase
MEGMGQLTLGFDDARLRIDRVRQIDDSDLFLEADPRELFIGAQRLEAYLDANGLGWVLRLAALLKELDYSALVRAYCPTGRRALHPRTLLGLIVYGILSRQWSLRELEGLARRDLGAWWVCGGHQPDHSTIGKFIQLYAEILTEEFFVGLVKSLANKLRLGPSTVAGDGTVIEAAASRYRLLRAEAVIGAALETRAAAEADPSEPQLARKARAAQEAAALLQERMRRRRWRVPEDTELSLREPEAVLQPRKDGVSRPSYKPSAMVHEAGLIVGQHVDPTNERAAVEPMLEQHQAAFGRLPPTVLLDAGFASNSLFQLLVEAEIDVLCPTGRASGDDDWERRQRWDSGFRKQAFRYISERDVYQCPVGRELIFSHWSADSHGRRYARYRGTRCDDCPLRERCTADRDGRTLKRYVGEELKELMAEVLSQPAARARYRRRAAIVEPLFAELRERQGLRRFHRRGLKSVRAEFALHCIAFNLKKAMAQLLIVFSHWRRRLWQPLHPLHITAAFT